MPGINMDNMDLSSNPLAVDVPVKVEVYYGTGQLYSMSILWVILAGVVVFARLGTRLYIVKNPAADDLLIVVALLASVAMSITMIAQVNAGMNTPKADTLKVYQAFWASVWNYNLSLTFTKVSIAVSYFRIFIQANIRRICWVVLVVLILFGAWTVVGSIIVCLPISDAWMTMNLYGSDHCQNRYTAWFFNASIHMVLDLVLIIMPMPVLKKLNMPIRQKIALMMVFALGTFVCVMSAIRLYFLVSMSTSNDNKNTAMWSVIETNVGIICASLPSLKALISFLWPKFSDYTGDSRGGKPTTGRITHDMFGASVGMKSGHSTRVQGNYNPATHSWGDNNEPFSGNQSEFPLKSFGTQQRGKSYCEPTRSGSQDIGIAVTTILEQEIETMAIDGRSMESISSEGSQKIFFGSDTKGGMERKEEC